MSVADEFPIPPGDPAGLLAAGDALKRVAADVAKLGGSARAESAGMGGAWTGEAAKAATTETTGLATITEDEGHRVGDGAAAFTAYGTALDTAVRSVQDIRRQALAADSDARSEANRTGHNLPPDDRYAIYSGLRDQALAPLRMRYRSVIESLEDAGRQAASALTGAVPEYRSGMSPAAVALAVRDSVAGRLPSVQQLDGQTRGRDLADTVKPLLEKGDKIPDDLLARIEANKDNPWFAKRFLERLGPRMPLWTLDVAEAQGWPPDYNRRIVTDLGQLLALGTRIEGEARLSESYVDTLLLPLDQHNGIGVEAAWKLGNLLHHGGTFGEDFLTKAGDKLYALDKDGADSEMYTLVGGWTHRPLTGDPGIPDDAMEAYFDAVAKNARAAQNFFAGHADRLDHYLVDRRTDDYLGDGGESLGRALEAATTAYRDDGETGRKSAQITADLVRVLGGQSHDQLVEHDRAKVLPSVARILNGYSDDVFYSLSRTDYGGAAATAARLGQPELGGKNWGVDFSAADLRGVLGQIDHDTEAYKSVVAAQLSASELFLQDKLLAARQDPAQRDHLLQSYARSHGLVLRQLFETHLGTQAAIGRLEDFDTINKIRFGGSASGSILGILPAIPHPAFLVGGMALVTAHSLIMPGFWEDATRPGNTAADRAAAESQRQIDSWYSGTLSTMIVRMQDGGGFAGTPAEATTWQRQHGITGAAAFTDASRRVIAPDEMTDAQRASLNRWLSDPENEGVRVEMVRMFTALDAAGGQRGG
ncbi:MAG TPA: hypothetical protein VF109_12645 [Mycobacteriales bacterium]